MRSTPVFLALAVRLLHLAGVHAFQPPSPTAFQQAVGRRSHADAGYHALRCLNALPRSRRECVSLIIATTSIAIAAPASSRANAAPTDNPAALKYNGVYTDPKHPKGYRVLIGSTKSATIKLQDDPSAEAYNLPVQVQMSTEEDEVKQFLFDFGPKGGPAHVVGVYSKDREGIPVISFPDGNAWKKRETGPIGVYRDGADPDKIIVIRQSKGPALTVDLIEKGGDKVTTFGAKAGNPTIAFDFPGGAGPVAGVANLKRKIISFEDGNVWTKF